MPSILPLLGLIILLSPIYLLYLNRRDATFEVVDMKRNERHDTLIVAITPTWKSVTRIPDMIALANTLALERDLFWVVVDNSTDLTDILAEMMERTNLPSTLLSALAKKGNSKAALYNAGIKYVVRNADSLGKKYSKIVVYFAEMEYSYDRRLWDNFVRKVDKLGIWHVGRLGEDMNEVHDGFAHFDLANIAFNVDILSEKTGFSEKCDQSGWEFCFVRELNISKEDVQYFENETPEDYLVWHAPTGYEPFLYQTSLFNFLVEV